MNKKKLTVNRLAMGNLKARKKQYTLMIIGIVLAMIFSSGVMFFGFTMLSSLQEITNISYGTQNIFLHNAEEFDFDAAKKNKVISEYGIATSIGFIYTNDDEGGGTPLAKLDDKAKEISYLTVKEGKYPENIGEIALEKDALLRLKLLGAKVGDEITVTMKIADGEGYLPETVERTYKLVGILADKRCNLEDAYSGNNYPAAFVCDSEKVELGGKENLSAYVKFYSKTNGYDKFKDEFINQGFKNEYGNADNDLYYFTFANQHIFYSGTDEKSDITLTMIFALILAGVLMIASCTGIVNAFNSNLQERRKQIGLMRAVGATRRQIITVFGREALIISLMTVPLSLVISYFASKGIISLMGENFIFIPNFFVLIACGMFSVICVMASAMIPLLRASRTPPMQAIRNTDLSRKMKNKQIRSKKNFNAPKILAGRNLMFYRFKHIGVSVVLAATIVVSCFGFPWITSELEWSENYINESEDYEIVCSGGAMNSNLINLNFNYFTSGFSENDRQEILSHPYVGSVEGVKRCNANLLVDEYSEYMTVLDYGGSARYDDSVDRLSIPFEEYKEKYDDTVSTEYSAVKETLRYTQELFPVSIHALDCNEIISEIDKDKIEGEINIDKLNSGEEIILFVCDEIGFFMDDKQGSMGSGSIDGDETEERLAALKARAKNEYKVGDTVTLSVLRSGISEDNYLPNSVPADTTRKDKEFRIGAIIKESPSSIHHNDYLDFYTTVEGFSSFVENYPYLDLDITLKEECTSEIDGEMMQFLNQYVSGSNHYLRSQFERNEENKNTYRGLLIALLSVVILFFSICASVINNSLTAQIRDGKREIGTLRAVGASARELTQSYFRQLLSMFGWGCGAGFGLYTFIWILMYFAAKSSDRTLDYNYEIWQAALICIALLAVCFVNLYSKVKKQMKYSIVENIREL